ncbi:conserved hypothetical protein [delta proteobacterium NaphS2]|nr:conserved hypothetical protein [delta proteobacterium NaphS2]
MVYRLTCITCCFSCRSGVNHCITLHFILTCCSMVWKKGK